MSDNPSPQVITRRRLHRRFLVAAICFFVVFGVLIAKRALRRALPHQASPVMVSYTPESVLNRFQDPSQPVIATRSYASSAHWGHDELAKTLTFQLVLSAAGIPNLMRQLERDLVEQLGRAGERPLADRTLGSGHPLRVEYGDAERRGTVSLEWPVQVRAGGPFTVQPLGLSRGVYQLSVRFTEQYPVAWSRRLAQLVRRTARGAQ